MAFAYKNLRCDVDRDFRHWESETHVSWWSRWWRGLVPGFAAMGTIWGGMVTPEMFEAIPPRKSFKPPKSAPGWFARQRGEWGTLFWSLMIPAPVVVMLFLAMFGVI